MKLLIVSDTHGDTKTMDKIIKKENPDFVIHAGDHCLNNEDQINKYANYYVAGNNDYIGKDINIFNIENIYIMLTHGHMFSFFDIDKWEQELYKYSLDKNINLIIYGHSHLERFIKINNTYILNPGSLTRPRNKLNIPSYAILNIEKSKIKENNFEEVIKYL